MGGRKTVRVAVVITTGLFREDVVNVPDDADDNEVLRESPR